MLQEIFNSRGRLAVAALVALVGGGTLVYSLIPSQDDVLRNWDPDYKAKCTNLDPDSGLAVFTENGDRLELSARLLGKAGRVGRSAVKEIADKKTIFCYGHTEKDEEIHDPSLWNHYIVNELTTDQRVADYLYEKKLPRYMRDNTGVTAQYITPAALLWSRALRAVQVVAVIDATRTIYQNGVDPDDFYLTDAWRAIEANPELAEAAKIYETTLRANPAAPQDARKAAFVTAIRAEAMNNGDISFLQWYADKVDQQTVTRTRTNANGQSETYIDYEDPPYWVHSMDIDPDTLVALTGVVFDEPFMDHADAAGIKADRASIELHSYRPLMMFQTAEKRAAWHCRGHYRNEQTQYGVGIDRDMLKTVELPKGPGNW